MRLERIYCVPNGTLTNGLIPAFYRYDVPIAGQIVAELVEVCVMSLSKQRYKWKS